MSGLDIIQKFIPYLGYGNIISQKDMDQGDSAQRTGLFWALTKLLEIPKESVNSAINDSYDSQMNKLTVSPGIYRRSPNPSYWGYKEDNLSRDQWAMLQTAFAVNNDHDRLKESMIQLVKRGFFHQNTRAGTDDPQNKWKMPDISLPNHLSTFIRGMNWWILYPLLLVFDLGFFLDLYFRKNQKWDYDNMLAIQLLYANIKFKTPWSHFAMKKYDQVDALNCIHNYYRVDNGNNGIEPMYELYKEAFDLYKRRSVI